MAFSVSLYWESGGHLEAEQNMVSGSQKDWLSGEGAQTDASGQDSAGSHVRKLGA